MTKSFAQRARAAQKAGNLTLSDLARWWDRPVPTVRGWLAGETEPGGGPIDMQHAQELLSLLETLIARRKFFPMPRLSPVDRIEWMKDVRQQVMP